MARMRSKAAIRSKDAGRAIAGAIVAGLIYDVVKAGVCKLWIRWKPAACVEVADVVAVGDTGPASGPQAAASTSTSVTTPTFPVLAITSPSCLLSIHRPRSCRRQPRTSTV